MPIAVIWSALALQRLREIHDFIARDKPGAADCLIARLVAVSTLLGRFPELGRDAADARRELRIGGTPYCLVYRWNGKQVRILTVIHGRQE